MGLGLPSTLYVFLYVYKIKTAAAVLIGDLAERTRFELVVGLLLRQFSKLVVSATHPPLHGGSLPNCGANLDVFFDWCKCFLQ
jgi:hypothetical protein